MYKTLGVLMTALLASQAQATDLSKRSEQWEMGLIVSQMDSWDTSGRNGSAIDVDSDTGWGFLIGYNFNEHFHFGFEFIHNEQDYDATIIPDDPAGPPGTIEHELTNDQYNFNFTYNFLAKELTPFVTGGLGWSYLDSNVSDGGGGAVCWWDPWWGYVCDSYYSTYSDTAFSYSVGGGVRWDITRGFTLRASINQRWVDIDNVGDTPEMMYGKFEFVWRM